MLIGVGGGTLPSSVGFGLRPGPDYGPGWDYDRWPESHPSFFISRLAKLA